MQLRPGPHARPGPLVRLGAVVRVDPRVRGDSRARSGAHVRGTRIPGATAMAPAVVAAAVAAAVGAILGGVSTADARWTGWIGTSAAPWLVVAWMVARRSEGPLAAGTGVTAGIAAMMLTYEGTQEAIDRSSTYGYTLPWVVVTLALGIAATAWRSAARNPTGPVVAAGAGAVAVPIALLAVFQAVVRRPDGSAVGVAVALACAAGLALLERRAVARHPGAAALGAVSGSVLFALGGFVVVAP